MSMYGKCLRTKCVIHTSSRTPAFYQCGVYQCQVLEFGGQSNKIWRHRLAVDDLFDWSGCQRQRLRITRGLLMNNGVNDCRLLVADQDTITFTVTSSQSDCDIRDNSDSNFMTL